MNAWEWRKRYQELGLDRLQDELRAGRPRTSQHDTVAALINQVLQNIPPLAAHTGPPNSGCSNGDLQTHSAPLATDLFLPASEAEVVQDFRRSPSVSEDSETFSVCTCMYPRDKEMVLYVVEKAQIQALDRSLPLPDKGVNTWNG